MTGGYSGGIEMEFRNLSLCASALIYSFTELFVLLVFVVVFHCFRPNTNMVFCVQGCLEGKNCDCQVLNIKHDLQD